MAWPSAAQSARWWMAPDAAAAVAEEAALPVAPEPRQAAVAAEASAQQEVAAEAPGESAAEVAAVVVPRALGEVEEARPRAAVQRASAGLRRAVAPSAAVWAFHPGRLRPAAPAQRQQA